MSNSNSAVGALILVPVVIAFCAAFLALKTVGLFKHIYKFVHPYWSRLTHWSCWNHITPTRKIRKSNLSTFRTYGDSWCDLESVASDQESYSRFVGQSPRKTSRSKTSTSAWDKDDFVGPDLPQAWHPSRSTRLRWSFTNPRSSRRSPFESSNVVRRSPESRSPGIFADHKAPTAPPKAKVAPPSVRTGP
jgi:hypothetical protein